MENPQYTNKISLVIERTSNGLDYDYVSPGINRQELRKLHISFDETNEVGQFNQGFCYSIKQTEHYLVYSIIYTSHKDNAKRNGFYAVRLIVKQNEFIDNVFVNLGKVASQYRNHVNTNNFNNQNYDAILSEIVKDVKKKHWITPKIDLEKVVYYQFINLNEVQNALINNLKFSYANKIYFLNDVSAQSDGIAKQFGFQPLSILLEKIKEIRFSNPHHQQISLSIDTQSFSTSRTQVDLVCKVTDVVKYKVSGERQPHLVGETDKEVVIQQQQNQFPNIPLNSNSIQSKKHSSSLILPWVLGIAIGIAGGYFGGPYLEELISPTPVPQYASEDTSPIQNGFGIKIYDSEENVVHLKSSDTLLNKYVFKYTGKSNKWQYFPRDGKNKMNLTSKELGSLLKKDSGRIEVFNKELQEVISAVIPKDNSDNVKESEETKVENKKPENSGVTVKSTEDKKKQNGQTSKKASGEAKPVTKKPTSTMINDSIKTISPNNPKQL